MNVISQIRLKEVLHYNPETGIFTWIKPTAFCIKAGDIAGYKNKLGYVKIVVDKKYYHAHRLAYIYMNGVMPEKYLDHIDGCKDNNKWANLRNATPSQNCQNIKTALKTNSTKLLGVTLTRGRTKYQARIVVNRKIKHLGMFDTAEEAHQAYLTAKRELHEFCTI